MTFRAILIGLLLGLGIVAVGYFNDWIMAQSYLATNLIPVCVYGFLLIGLLLVNPFLRAIRARSFSAPEWAVMAALMLVVCVIPGPGLTWHFANSLLMPHHYNKTTPGWSKYEVLRYAPKAMLAAPTEKNFDEVVGCFKAGLPEQKVDLTKVPWEAWTRTLSFWLPLLALSFVAGICLVMVVHEQWSKRERLRYPLAYVAAEVVGGWGTEGKGGIFRDKKFWIGFLIPAVILLINGYFKWNPTSIQIPLTVNMEGQLYNRWPILRSLPGAWWILAPTVYFSAVGIAYFISSEISFSLGMNGIVFGAVFVSLTVSGIDLTGGQMTGGNINFQMFGSYLGLALVALYTGRRFYASVLGRALGRSRGDPVEPYVVWACRLAILGAVGMVLLLVFGAGLHWPLAVLYVLMTGLMYMILTRINVETGLFMIQPGWCVVGVLLGFFGFAAIGPHMLVILGILATVIAVDPIVSLMPLAANAIKLGESHHIRPPRLSRWMTLAVLLALVVGVVATIAVQYAHGGCRYGWADTVAKMPFDMLQRNLQKTPGDPSVVQGLAISKINAKPSFLFSAAIGLALVLALSALRLRFTWWPIHPVLFLVWGTFPGYTLGASFLLGWLIKTGVTTFGGGRAYRSYRPMFIGLIAGEFAAAIFWSIVGVSYYFAKGVPGPEFRILPA